MFTHPVNEDTLNAFTLNDSSKVVHLPSGIILRDYAFTYYDYFIEHYDQLSSQILSEPNEIEAAKILHLSLVDMIETGGYDLKIPAPLLPINMDIINDAGCFIKVYCEARKNLVRDITILTPGEKHSRGDFPKLYFIKFRNLHIKPEFRGNIRLIEFIL